VSHPAQIEPAAAACTTSSRGRLIIWTISTDRSLLEQAMPLNPMQKMARRWSRQVSPMNQQQ
jgi:hypothetical protein